MLQNDQIPCSVGKITLNAVGVCSWLLSNSCYKFHLDVEEVQSIFSLFHFHLLDCVQGNSYNEVIYKCVEAKLEVLGVCIYFLDVFQDQIHSIWASQLTLTGYYYIDDHIHSRELLLNTYLRDYIFFSVLVYISAEVLSIELVDNSVFKNFSSLNMKIIQLVLPIVELQLCLVFYVYETLCLSVMFFLFLFFNQIFFSSEKLHMLPSFFVPFFREIAFCFH